MVAAQTGGPCADPAPVNPCVPGGGAKGTDCHVEWMITPVPALTRLGVPKSTAVCYEGDPRCDVDGINDRCAFSVRLCANNPDRRFPRCLPGAVSAFEVKRPPLKSADPSDIANRSALESAAGPGGLGLGVLRNGIVLSPGQTNFSLSACTGPFSILVPLRPLLSGRRGKGHTGIRIRATGVSGAPDTDSVRFECRPSTCGNHIVETDHEDCDDGNRDNGDGCDAGCHVESPTPSPSATPTASLTPTAGLAPSPTASPTLTRTPAATASVTRTPTASATTSVTLTASLTPTTTATDTATPTDTSTATATLTATPSHTPTNSPSSTPIDSATPTATVTRSGTATATSTRTATATASPTATVTNTSTATLTPTATPTNLPPVHVDVTPFPGQAQLPCLIFVHGKQTNTDTYTDWNAARSYWQNGSDDFIRTATKNFAAPYYVVGYNGMQAYWDAQAAGEVASQIVNATNGGADGGGNVCPRTYAAGGTFWVIGHSMAGSILDYILGNADPSDPSYNRNGPYDLAAQRITVAVTLAGTHRGSQGADLACGSGNPFCSFFAQFIQSCDTATYWLRSSDDVQVKTFASPPAKTVWLTGGYAAIIGASACLSGEDDGLVQFASIFACNGSATASYGITDVCDNGNKQEVSGFQNLDTPHENHDQERNDSHRDTRQSVPTGVWVCNGAPCAPGTTVQSAMSSAQFVSLLY